jgi:hypothetical protein
LYSDLRFQRDKQTGEVSKKYPQTMKP